MGKLNNVLYPYLSDPERFADLFNGSLFKGEQVLHAEQMETVTERYIRKDEDGEYRETERDIRKVLRDGLMLQIFAVENQSYVSYMMPLRCMGYDVREYQQQIAALEKENREQKRLRGGDEYLSGLRAGDRLVPVYTIVLYWGEKEWQGPRRLSDMMGFEGNEKLRELFCDYSMHLVCVSEIENCEDYRSDLRDVFRLLKYRGDKEKMYAAVKERDEYRHLSEDTYDVLALLLGDSRLPMKKEKVYLGEEGGYDMCQALTELYEDWKNEGIEEGERRLLELGGMLISAGRDDELIRIFTDEGYREKLNLEFDLLKSGSMRENTP